MDRYEHDAEFVNYAVVVTLDYIECTEDVYDITLKTYNKLEVTKWLGSYLEANMKTNKL